MIMLLSFIKSIRNEITIIFCIFLLFALIFYLFSLPFSAFGLALGIVLLIIFIHWWVKYLGFKRNEDLKEKIDNLENELTEVKSPSRIS